MKEKIQSIVNNEITPAKTIDALHKLFIDEQIRMLEDQRSNIFDADHLDDVKDNYQILISQLKDQLK